MKDFLLALRLISNLPLPESADEPGDPRRLALFFPLAGLLIGLLMSAVAEVVIAVTTPVVAAVACGVLLPLSYAALTRFHGLSGMSRVLEVWEVPGGDPEGPHGRLYRDILILQMLMLLKCLLVGLVVYYERTLWLAVVPFLSHCAWSELLVPDAPETADVPKTKQQEVPVHWVVATLVSLGLGVLSGSFAAGLLTPVLAYLFIVASRTLLIERMGDVTPPGVYAATEKLELLVLLVGVLFFAA